MALIELAGQKFGRWTVERLGEKRGRVNHWWCVCECGVRREVNGCSLREGASTSCGCYASEWSVKKHTSHGMHKHPAYLTWRAMRRRCQLPTDPGYKDYGGRGITVCDTWQSFEGFWADMGATWAEGLTIDRKNTNGNYLPDNCRWATPKQQGNNRRNNVMIQTPLGPMNVTQASETFGVNRNTITRRMRDGWLPKELLEPAEFSVRWHTQLKGDGE